VFRGCMAREKAASVFSFLAPIFRPGRVLLLLLLLLLRCIGQKTATGSTTVAARPAAGRSASLLSRFNKACGTIGAHLPTHLQKARFSFSPGKLGYIREKWSRATDASPLASYVAGWEAKRRNLS